VPAGTNFHKTFNEGDVQANSMDKIRPLSGSTQTQKYPRVCGFSDRFSVNIKSERLGCG